MTVITNVTKNNVLQKIDNLSYNLSQIMKKSNAKDEPVSKKYNLFSFMERSPIIVKFPKPTLLYTLKEKEG
jgi:hypothetical protein